MKRYIRTGKLQAEGLAFCSPTLLGGAHPSCFIGRHWWNCSNSGIWASPYPPWIGWFYSHWDRGAATCKSAFLGMFAFYSLPSFILFGKCIHYQYAFKCFRFMTKLLCFEIRGWVDGCIEVLIILCFSQVLTTVPIWKSFLMAKMIEGIYSLLAIKL